VTAPRPRPATASVRRPWHQTWWAAALWTWIPVLWLYGVYVLVARLSWKERAAAALTILASVPLVMYLLLGLDLLGR
jgi:hypothetical protein